jgi:hypothetical protein
VDVHSYCSTCDVCQRAKRQTGKRYGLMQKIENPSRPWDSINMDFITELPPAGDRNYNAVLVIVDRFSRRCRFLPTHDSADAKDTALLFWRYCWSDTGMPRTIVSDRDPKFTSEFWQSLMALSETRLALSTAYHPQTDGLVERMNQTLEDMLRRFVAFGITYKDSMGFVHDWVTVLPALELAHNSAVHSTTHKTPFEVERGFLPRVPRFLISAEKQSELRIDPSAASYADMIAKAQARAQEAINDAFEYAKSRWDASHTPPPFKVGDSVLLSTKNISFDGSKKLQEPYIGPFAIIRLIGPNAVELALTGSYIRRHPVFPVSLLKLYKAGDPELFPGRSQPPPPEPVVLDGQAEYEVEEVLDERVTKDL